MADIMYLPEVIPTVVAEDDTKQWQGKGVSGAELLSIDMTTKKRTHMTVWVLFLFSFMIEKVPTD